MPASVRENWLRKLRHTKIKFVFSACSPEAGNLRRGIYSFTEPEPEPVDGNPDEEEKLLENVHRDYEGPYQVMTPSFTTAKESIADGGANKDSLMLDDEECVDIEDNATSGIPSNLAAGQFCGRGIRIVQVTEDDVTQKFYALSKLPTRSTLNW